MIIVPLETLNVSFCNSLLKYKFTDFNKDIIFLNMSKFVS